MKLSKIKLDKQNFNKHTPEGMELLEKSIKEVGAIESVTIDKEGDVVGRSEQLCRCGKPEEKAYSPCCSLTCWCEQFE